MGKYWRFRGHENLDKAMFPGSGPYEVPRLSAVHTNSVEMISYYQATAYKGDRANEGVHFFMFDAQFQRMWEKPDDYLSLLKQYSCVCSPDFSLYTDYPTAVQIWNHYRKHWLGAYWASKGITVVPTIAWSDESSFSWCFSGEPVGSDVAVSSVGTQSTERSKALFLLGYRTMMRRLKPEKVYFQGKVPDGCEGNIVKIPENLVVQGIKT